MPAPILAAKLFAPSKRSRLVPRPRLIERLDAGLERKLSLISAPAGFGKTTLAGEWAAVCGRRVAWLSLDAGDNDPLRFVTYLAAAVQSAVPQVGGGVLAALQAGQPPPVETLLVALLNEIAGVGEPFVLVLDDYHVIEAGEVEEALAFVVEHQPPQMHLVIAGREDPWLGLSRLRGRGQLTELRLADLRFTPAEAAEFLNRVMGLELRDAEIEALERRTEGWIAGLQLAALSMQGREDIGGFIRAFTGSHRFVLDYLVEEVLQRQTEGVRSFLLQTAVLERMCAGLCNAVTGREDGKEMLEGLERDNLFLIPLDDRREWYRYHHLFAEMLQAHLQEAQAEGVSGLHVRASEWYERNGLRAEAIRHALAAKDLARAAGLIELAWPAAEEGSFQSTTWLGWVKTLPEALVHARPVLTVGYAFALLGSGELEAAEARLQDAEGWLEAAQPLKVPPQTPPVEMVVVDQEQFKSLAATIAVGRAYIAQTLGNHSETIRYASRVLELTGADPFRHSQASMLLGLTHWASGNPEAADRVFAEYTMKLRAAGNLPDAISTSAVLADMRLVLGRLHEAIHTVEQCLQFVIDQGEPIPFDTADLHRELCELYLEQGNLEAAAHHLQTGKELGEKAELPVLRYRLWIAQARLKTAQGDLDGALASLEAAERLYIRSPLPDFQPISAMKARIWVTQGKLTQAQEWAREQGLSPDDSPGFLGEFAHITLARILIAQFRDDQVEEAMQAVLRLLDRLLQAAEAGGRMGSVIEILVLQALAHQARGEISPALAALERGLTLAEPQGYVRIIAEEGQPVRELLARMAAQDGTPRFKAYLRTLLAALDAHPVMEPSGGPLAGNLRTSDLAGQAAHPQPLIEPLSERELEILKLLRTDLSGPEIARQLIVSLSTIRTHTQHIYAKLGVSHRRAAVRRAEELDLL